jgi:hypothetical protein
MTKLEAGQVWIGTIKYRLSTKSTRREIVKTAHGRRELLIHFVSKAGLHCCYEREFRAWIERTNATLQETKP